MNPDGSQPTEDNEMPPIRNGTNSDDTPIGPHAPPSGKRRAIPRPLHVRLRSELVVAQTNGSAPGLDGPDDPDGSGGVAVPLQTTALDALDELDEAGKRRPGEGLAGQV